MNVNSPNSGLANNPGNHSATAHSQILTKFKAEKSRVARHLRLAYPRHGELLSTPVEDQSIVRQEVLHNYALSHAEFIKRLRDGSLGRWRGELDETIGWFIRDGREFRFLYFNPEWSDSAPVPQSKQLECGAYLYEFTTTIRVDEACLSLFESDDDIIRCVNIFSCDDPRIGEMCELRRGGRFVPIRETRRELRLWWQRMFSDAADTTRDVISVPVGVGPSSPLVATTAVQETRPKRRQRWKRMLSNVADTTRTTNSVLEEACSSSPLVAATAVREPRSKRRQRWKRMLSNVVDTVQTANSILAEASSSFPPVAAAAKGVQTVFTIKDTIKDHQTAAEHEIQRAIKLKEDVEEFIRCSSQNRIAFPTQPTQAIAFTCDEVRQNLKPISNSSPGSRLFRLNRNKDTIQNCRRRLDLAEREFVTARNSYLVQLNDSIDRRTKAVQANVIQIKVNQVKTLF
ncbi:hypothetical protein D9756_011041 [Leucocoprinus leucothites]|uniref:Uncharacterized protein n=1 Tax=Leucocoprinus leucothites TaxID=201217 RepID=A0A8H5FR39_9AGAR|nr:hypothetical protein D9756_011041 [Leucoagaricus leucothites]